MRQEEKRIEQECVKIARRSGWDAWKNEKNGNVGIPDFSFLRGGVFFFVEFKKSNKAHISKEQKFWQNKHPEFVFFCSSVSSFLQLLKMFEEE